MKNLAFLCALSIGGLSCALCLSCSAGDGEGGGGSKDAAGGGSSDSSDDGETPDEPAGRDGGRTAEDGTSSFEDYAPSCDEQECSSDEVCQQTESGSECFKPCPGQPCPPVDGLVSFCDRQGGVSCFEE